MAMVKSAFDFDEEKLVWESVWPPLTQHCSIPVLLSHAALHDTALGTLSTHLVIKTISHETKSMRTEYTAGGLLSDSPGLLLLYYVLFSQPLPLWIEFVTECWLQFKPVCAMCCNGLSEQPWLSFLWSIPCREAAPLTELQSHSITFIRSRAGSPSVTAALQHSVTCETMLFWLIDATI